MGRHRQSPGWVPVAPYRRWQHVLRAWPVDAPEPVTETALRAAVGGSAGAVREALAGCGLIDAQGRPTPRWRAGRADPAAWEPMLRDAATDAYPGVLRADGTVDADALAACIAWGAAPSRQPAAWRFARRLWAEAGLPVRTPPAALPAVLDALLAELPPAGTPWSAAEREAWLTFWAAAVRHCFPGTDETREAAADGAR